MQLPTREALRLIPPTTAPMSRWETGEQIPWMSWSVTLVWAAAEVDVASFLAAQPSLRSAALGESGAWPCAPLTADALDTTLQEALRGSPLPAAPIRAAWRLVAEHGRIDEDTTTSTEHVLLITDAHIIYAVCYQETLH